MNITKIIDSKPVVVLPPENIYHLPSPLTHLQKSLIEVLLKLHKSNLMKIIDCDIKDEQQDRATTTTTTTTTTSDDEVLSQNELLKLLAHNWQSIISHPFLLVDHFIPKKLILMESSPNLIKDSGKFKQFDDLVNKLEQMSYNVIVVARTIKEIDLIESYLLGRKLNYKRYTGASLYDINTYQESSSSSTNMKNSSSNGHSSYSKRKRSDDYIPKISKNNPQFQYIQKNPKEKLTLHLISSNQVKTMNFNENLKFNLIISFDSLLTNLTYLRQVKSVNDHLIPLVKLVVFNSIEHFQMVSGKDVNGDDLQKLVFQAIIDRSKDYEVKVDVEWLKDYTKVEWVAHLNKPEFQYNKDEMMNSLNRDVGLNNTKKFKLEQIKSDFKFTEYKHLLTKLIMETITETSGFIVDENVKLNPIRSKDSSIQLEIETKNVKIAELVKSKQALEVELNALTKRVEKLNSDVIRYELLTKTKNEILQDEEGIISSKNQEIKIDELELEQLNMLNEQTRSEYQLNSSKLLESSMKLTLVTNENTKLKKKLNDTIHDSINEQMEKINNERHQYAIDKLSRENKFLVDYNNKINSIVRNNNIFDSNGRSINGRLSRSTTPRI